MFEVHASHARYAAIGTGYVAIGTGCGAGGRACGTWYGCLRYGDDV